MSTWRRRIRGSIRMGLVWGAAWFFGGLALALAFPGAADVPFFVLWGAFGFVGGVLFSLLLGLAEGRRSFGQMSLARFAVWGGLGGLLLCAGFVGLTAAFGELAPLRHALLLGPVFATAGAGSASGSLALARWADRGALEAGDDGRKELSADDRP